MSLVMDKIRTQKKIAAVVLIGLAAGAAWAGFNHLRDGGGPGGRSGRDRPAPVAVAPVERGPIEYRRTFSGTLEAPAEFEIAPKVSGRIERLAVGLADTVRRGQVVAELDDDEYLQAVAQAKADLAVAEAHRAEAESAVEIAAREFKRTEILLGRGVASESQFDAAKINQLTRQAGLEVAEAQVTRAESALKTANIRLGYTRIRADWSGGDDRRVVAERFVAEGETVSANTRLFLIVELDPINGVIFVTEKDYAHLKPDQAAWLVTDAFPDERFEGRIRRIAPIFSETTRQARVEMAVRNPRHRLKPGMFIRATVVLDREEEAVIVPDQALTVRGGRTGVFVLDEEKRTVSWRDVKVGIRDGQRVQVKGDEWSGKVVTLGHQLIDDGSPVVVAEQGPGPTTAGTPEGG